MTPLLLAVVLSADLNAEGFALYKKGEYAKADALFQKAIAATPKNAWAWLNHARALALLAKGQDPDEYCDYEHNWVLLALDALEHAVALDRAKVLAKWAEPDPGTDALKKRPEVQLWWAAITFDPAKKREFIAAHPDWHLARPGDVLRPLHLDAKGWSLTPDGKVQLAGKKEAYPLEVKPWCFAEGKKCFSAVTLGDWALGPGFADCD